MTISDLRLLFSDVSGFSVSEWETMSHFVRAWKPKKCLDLGYGNGVSTICIATAMRELGKTCDIKAIDSASSQQLSPNIEVLRKRAGLDGENISISTSGSSINVSFIELLEKERDNGYDLIHIDGERSWCSMGFSVLLAERMLNDDGWLVINGVDHERPEQPQRDGMWHDSPPSVRVATRQVNKIFELLICTKRHFSVCRRRGGRYFAQFSSNPSVGVDTPEMKMEISNVLDRAHRDPDYRFDLLWNARKVTARRIGNTNQWLNEVSFRDSKEDVAIGQEYDSNQRAYLLGTPSWSSQLSRQELIDILVIDN